MKTDRFAKTGSGRTSGELKKEAVLQCDDEDPYWDDRSLLLREISVIFHIRLCKLLVLPGRAQATMGK
jgi:hypothetical protein